MKPDKVSVLVGKKRTELINPVQQMDGKMKYFVHSWDIHYSVAATLDPGEDYHNALRHLNNEVKRMVNDAFGDETKVKLELVVNR